MAEVNVYKSGTVNVSDEVIGVIGSIAASEIPGVHALSGSFSEEMMERIGKKSFQKGVHVQLTGDTAVIELDVIIDQGNVLAEIGERIQRAVTLAVESMTGITVTAVHVNIQGLSFKSNG